MGASGEKTISLPVASVVPIPPAVPPDWREILRAAVVNGVGGDRRTATYARVARRARPGDSVLRRGQIARASVIAVLLDVSPSMEEFRSVATWIAAEAARAAGRLCAWLVTWGDYSTQVFEPGRWPSEWPQASNTVIWPAVAALEQLSPQPGLVVVISDCALADDWPASQPGQAPWIVLRVGDEGGGPEWSRTIEVVL